MNGIDSTRNFAKKHDFGGLKETEDPFQAFPSKKQWGNEEKKPMSK